MLIVLELFRAHNTEHKDAIASQIVRQIGTATGLLPQIIKWQLRDEKFDVTKFVPHDDLPDQDRQKYSKKKSPLEYFMKSCQDHSIRKASKIMEIDHLLERMNGGMSVKETFLALHEDGIAPFESMVACIMMRLELLKDIHNLKDGQYGGFTTMEWYECVERFQTIWGPYI